LLYDIHLVLYIKFIHISSPYMMLLTYLFINNSALVITLLYLLLKCYIEVTEVFELITQKLHLYSRK